MRSRINVLAALLFSLLSVSLATASDADSFTAGLAKHQSSLEHWATIAATELAATKTWLKGELGLPQTSEVALSVDQSGSAIQDGTLSGIVNTGASMLEDNKKSYHHGIKFKILLSPDVEKRVVLAQGKLELTLADTVTLFRDISAKCQGRVLAIAGLLEDERIVLVTLGLAKPTRYGKSVYQLSNDLDVILWLRDRDGKFKSEKLRRYEISRDGGTTKAFGEAGSVLLPKMIGSSGKDTFTPKGEKPIGLTQF